MIIVDHNIRGGGRAAVVHGNPQRSVHCEVSTLSDPYRMEGQVVGSGDSIVGLVRLEVQLIRAVLRTVVEYNVDRGLGIVLLIIDLGGARGIHDRLVVIAGVVPGNSAVEGRLVG